jgi:hypothetical protein
VEEFLNAMAEDYGIARATTLKIEIALELEGASARLCYGYAGLIFANATLNAVATNTTYCRSPQGAIAGLLQVNSAKGFASHVQAGMFKPAAGSQLGGGVQLAHSWVKLSLKPFNFKADDSGRIGVSDEQKASPGHRTCAFFGIATGPTATFGTTDLYYRAHAVLVYEISDQRDDAVSFADKLDALE